MREKWIIKWDGSKISEVINESEMDREQVQGKIRLESKCHCTRWVNIPAIQCRNIVLTELPNYLVKNVN